MAMMCEECYQQPELIKQMLYISLSQENRSNPSEINLPLHALNGVFLPERGRPVSCVLTVVGGAPHAAPCSRQAETPCMWARTLCT